MVICKFVSKYREGTSKVTGQQVNKFRLNVKVSLEKVLAAKPLMLRKLYSALSTLSKKYNVVDEIVKKIVDCNDYCVACEQAYAGKRYHVANHEEYGFDSSNIEYSKFNEILETFEPADEKANDSEEKDTVENVDNNVVGSDSDSSVNECDNNVVNDEEEIKRKKRAAKRGKARFVMKNVFCQAIGVHFYTKIWRS